MTSGKRSIFSVRPVAFAAVVVALAPASACSSTGTGIQGVSCATDGDCNGGLKCLPHRAVAEAGADAGCPPVDRLCLKPCSSDGDCTAQGPGLACLASCGGQAACEPR